MNAKERNELIDALIEGDISEADFLRLQAELTIDPAARRAYYDRVSLSMALTTAAAAQPAAKPQTAVRWRRWSPRVMAMAATLVALLAISALVWQGQKPTTTIAATELTASGYAVLAGQSGAVWEGASALVEGGLVPAGRLRLAAGAAQLELFSGVTVVLDGATEFEILSSMEMAVQRGKVRVRVPEPAHGFRIHTPEGEVVDLGTEFGLEVSEGASEVHVLNGEVEWNSAGADTKRMSEGQALHRDRSGAEKMLPASPADFVGIEQLKGRLAESRRERHASAREYSRKLDADERVMLHYSMEPAEVAERRLINHAGATSTGAVVAAAPTTDRFGEPGAALDFSPTGSRVRVNVPGEFRSLTLTCWVKINSLDRWYNSLFLTDGAKLTQPHWQIMNDGRLFFSVRKYAEPDKLKGERDKYHFMSPPFWTPSLSGQWLMITTVYDVDQRQVTHYLNGKLLSQEAIPEQYLVEQGTIGAASICNWSEPIFRTDPEFTVRNLNGSMDELALFSAALTPAEVAALYEHGKP